MEKESEIILDETSCIVADETPQKEQKIRKKVTVDTHLEKYSKLLKFIDDEIEKKQKNREQGIRPLQSIRRQVKEMEGEVLKVAKIKRKNPNSKKISGFSLECKITKEMADFMKISIDDTPTRNDITNAICAYAHINPNEKREQILKWGHLNPGGKRNLQDPKNKMYIIPDAKLRKLLNYDAYVKDVNEGRVMKKKVNEETGRKDLIQVKDPSLSYSVIQKLIQNQIIKTISKNETQCADFEILH